MGGASSDRIHRIKSKAISAFKDAHPTVPDGGDRTFAPSTRLLQIQGSLNIPIFGHYGDVLTVDVGCVCPAPLVAEPTSVCAFMPIIDNPSKRRFT